jgi:hypothetical protein
MQFQGLSVDLVYGCILMCDGNIYEEREQQKQREILKGSGCWRKSVPKLGS